MKIHLVGSGLSRWSVVAGRGRDGAAVSTSEATIAARGVTIAGVGLGEATSGAGDSSRNAAGILLGLVLDEVHLGLRWLRGCGRGDDNVLLILGLLHQHVDQSLLLVLRLQGNDRSLVRWWRWGLDEDDLVVLLGLANGQVRALAHFFLLWWWHVHVDVLLHQGGATTTTAAASESANAATCG